MQNYEWSVLVYYTSKLFAFLWLHIKNFTMLEEKCYYGCQHLPPYPDDVAMWADIQRRKVPGQIVQPVDTL